LIFFADGKYKNSYTDLQFVFILPIVLSGHS